MRYRVRADPGRQRTSTVPKREFDMGSAMVRYKVRPGRADENETLVRAVYEQLDREGPEGLHYATFRLPDGVSFMHIVFESDQPGRILGEVAAFKAFVTDIAARCDEPPVTTELTVVGSYRMGS
jgi:hypothetical protein